MRTRRVLHTIGSVVALLAAGTAAAQACTPPIPFQYAFQTQVQMTATAASPTDTCGFSVSTVASAGPSAAGFVHYRRAQPATLLRYGFRVDTTAWLPDLPTDAAQLFSASSPNVISGNASLLTVFLVGVSGSGPQLAWSAAASGAAGRYVAFSTLAPGVHTVRMEIATGAGTAGVVRYWVDHAFGDPPDGVVDDNGAGLDNAAWGGVIAAEIGLSSASARFRANHAGSALVFDRVESSDDVLFHDDFSSGAQ